MPSAAFETELFLLFLDDFSAARSGEVLYCEFLGFVEGSWRDDIPITAANYEGWVWRRNVDAGRENGLNDDVIRLSGEESLACLITCA